MGRNATIKIVNQTSYQLTYMTSDIQHGKFNEDPPAKIAPGDTGTFEVGNNMGAKIGPQGKAIYTFIVETVTETLYIFWNHPFGSATSTYSVESSLNTITYTQSPANPSGHDQQITLTVSD